MTIKDQIADRIDFLSDHWVNGDDKKPFQFGGWREEVIDGILEIFDKSLLEKKSVEELRAVMGNAFTDLSVQVAFKEGYNQAIKEMKQKVSQ